MMYSFDDVLVVPKYSEVKSRSQVSLVSNFGRITSTLPIINSNMDSVASDALITEMHRSGAVGSLHRFQTIDQNVGQFQRVKHTDPVCAFGIGEDELNRLMALYDAGCSHFMLDVAHGASRPVVDQLNRIPERVWSNATIIVGNFATASSTKDTLDRVRKDVSGIKVGIGGGSACTTRIVTGCGLPTLASVIDCAKLGLPIIADGGCRTPGDVFKALVGGASLVMMGGTLAGSLEAPSELVTIDGKQFKRYRGSASAGSYVVQGKVANHRTPEGAEFLVPYSGEVNSTLQKIEAGIRSGMSYIGAHTIPEIRERGRFEQVSYAGANESRAHGADNAR
jgi:IMP dehydrogenase